MPTPHGSRRGAVIRTSLEQPHTPPHHTPKGTPLAAAWAILAALVLLGLTWRNRGLSLDGDFQGWGSASCMLMARAFNQLGALHTHFVPLQNNLPLGRDPDVYLHWPPLYPLVLAWCLRHLGNSVFTGRLLAWAINLCSGIVLAGIGRQLYNARLGALAAFFFFTSRAVFVGNSALLQQPLAMLFALVATFCFLHGLPATGRRPAPWITAAGLCSTALMVFSAWDPIFVPFGLLATALFLREKAAIRRALAYCVAALAAFFAVELDYILSYPRLFANQFATIAYRAGLHFHGATSMRLGTYVDAAVFSNQFGLFAGSWRALRFAVQYFSPFSLALVVLFFASVAARRRTLQSTPAAPDPALWILGGSFLPAVLWYVVMRNYVAIHPFPLILFAPSVALAGAYFTDRLWTWWSDTPARRPEQLALVYIVPLLLLLPLLIEFRDAPQQPPHEFTALSQLIETNTPPSAVVLTSATSLVPTLESHRHLVRGILQDAWLTQAITQAHQDFPGAPLFFAVQDRDRPYLLHAFDQLGAPKRLGDAALYALP